MECDAQKNGSVSPPYEVPSLFIWLLQPKSHVTDFYKIMMKAILVKMPIIFVKRIQLSK